MSNETPVSVTVTAYLTRNPSLPLSMVKLLAAVKAKHKEATVPYIINVHRVNASKGVKQSDVYRDDMIVGQFKRKPRKGTKPKMAKPAARKHAKAVALKKSPQPSAAPVAKSPAGQKPKAAKVTKVKPAADSGAPDISDILNGL